MPKPLLRVRLGVLLLCAVLALSACTSTGQSRTASAKPPSSQQSASSAALKPAKKLTQRDKNWVEDIRYFRDTYAKKHVDLFY